MNLRQGTDEPGSGCRVREREWRQRQPLAAKSCQCEECRGSAGQALLWLLRRQVAGCTEALSRAPVRAGRGALRGLGWVLAWLGGSEGSVVGVGSDSRILWAVSRSGQAEGDPGD